MKGNKTLITLLLVGLLECISANNWNPFLDAWRKDGNEAFRVNRESAKRNRADFMQEKRRQQGKDFRAWVPPEHSQPKPAVDETARRQEQPSYLRPDLQARRQYNRDGTLTQAAKGGGSVQAMSRERLAFLREKRRQQGKTRNGDVIDFPLTASPGHMRPNDAPKAVNSKLDQVASKAVIYRERREQLNEAFAANRERLKAVRLRAARNRTTTRYYEVDRTSPASDLSRKKPKKKLNSTINHCYNRRYKRGTKTGKAWATELVGAANKWAKNSSIVLTGGDWGYRATVLNWMAHAEHVGMTQYVVLCYGQAMLDLVGSWEHGGHGILVLDCKRVIEFMFMKITGMYILHGSRYTVTWSDCDALWLKPNILEDWILPYRRRLDFLSQKALHPVTISNQTGSTICTGLFTVFPSQRSDKAMTYLMQAVRSYRVASDQNLVNKYLARIRAFRFKGKIVYDDEDMEQIVATPNYRNGSDPRLGFLPSGVFPRSRTMDEWAYVQKHDPALWHSKTDKVGRSKIDGMRNASVFALRDGWESVTRASEVPSIVDRSVLEKQGWKQFKTRFTSAADMRRARESAYEEDAKESFAKMKALKEKQRQKS